MHMHTLTCTRTHIHILEQIVVATQFYSLLSRSILLKILLQITPYHDLYLSVTLCRNHAKAATIIRVNSSGSELTTTRSFRCLVCLRNMSDSPLYSFLKR